MSCGSLRQTGLALSSGGDAIILPAGFAPDKHYPLWINGAAERFAEGLGLNHNDDEARAYEKPNPADPPPGRAEG